ncbi:hypothetical protein Gasu2_64730 [Galdieria sulphuraria]|uniref:Monopolin complex subunit Csm1/Pcs1 C-terminal domain-containing protein n=1 Tax=Galdieria sulphuraria TaxID=130081 RepID=M2X3Y8_GALSU|nr:uncharacterized protein Gasu_16410 [Galdieria sulphuraria]EME31145.1 hypothetical protein Gasu_16410 [Galdieria sulphuraria]GJD12385.1 hypothetical protein Gasu2_64730 [Galdieria sulphuraria]|eukprot:XP_005707665.1 hypothetical protein Gasu_16410 [Galdieria sulphuraria]
MTRFLEKRHKKKKATNKERILSYKPIHAIEQENSFRSSRCSNQTVEVSAVEDSRSALVGFFESNEPSESVTLKGKRERQVRFADKTNTVGLLKESLEEKLLASKTLISQLKEENCRLKERLNEVKDQLELKEKIALVQQENNDLEAEVLEWKAKFYESESEKERILASRSRPKDGYEIVQESLAQQPGTTSFYDYKFRQLVHKLTRMNAIHSKHNDKEYHKCDIVNESKDRSITFELFIDEEQEEIEYVPVQLNGVSQKLPSYLQDNISFDVQNAPIFFTKIMHSLFSK